MEELIRHINRQVQFNKRKNLLCREPVSDFEFSQPLISYIKEHLIELKNLDGQQEEMLFTYLVDKAIESLCEANQFYYFNTVDRIALRKIYYKLHSSIKSLSEPQLEQGLQDLAKGHYRTLQG